MPIHRAILETRVHPHRVHPTPLFQLLNIVSVDGIVLSSLVVIKGQLDHHDHIGRDVVINPDVTSLTLEVNLSGKDALEL
jgi:hypothetical protein